MPGTFQPAKLNAPNSGFLPLHTQPLRSARRILGVFGGRLFWTGPSFPPPPGSLRGPGRVACLSPAVWGPPDHQQPGVSHRPGNRRVVSKGTQGGRQHGCHGGRRQNRVHTAGCWAPGPGLRADTAVECLLGVRGSRRGPGGSVTARRPPQSPGGSRAARGCVAGCSSAIRGSPRAFT